MNDFDGKVALVTGGSRGIGAAIARALAQRGAKIALAYRTRRDVALEVAKTIRDAGGVCEIFAADVSDSVAVDRMIAEVVARFGHIDVLVNNAGVAGGRAFGENDAAFFAEQFHPNVLGPILVTQAAVRHFPSSGGRVINLSSNLAYAPEEGLVVYSAAKAAVSALTRGFAKELGPRGITVNAVAPGITATDMTNDIPAEHRADVTVRTPLRRLGDTSDIVGAVLFLGSPAASWVTGQTLLAGGVHVDR